jgi:hypothetical protein
MAAVELLVRHPTWNESPKISWEVLAYHANIDPHRFETISHEWGFKIYVPNLFLTIAF